MGLCITGVTACYRVQAKFEERHPRRTLALDVGQ
jgi:hypothetical protein